MSCRRRDEIVIADLVSRREVDGLVLFFFFFKEKAAIEVRLKFGGSEMCIRGST